MPEPNIHQFKSSFTTESGYELSKPEIAYRSWGTLNADKSNVIVVCHALTGNTDADIWFEGLFGKGKPLDPEKHFILCPNILGSCYGSTGPASINPKTGNAYQADFPEVTIRDIVRFNQKLIDDLEISSIEMVIGGSLGGMTALEWTIMDERVKSSVVIGMGKAHSAWAIGISEAQRMAIRADENWNKGFYSPDNPPNKGLAAARAMAMITYRTPENYEQKFGRKLQAGEEVYQVESYLNYQGKKLTSRFDANAYITLSAAMDKHDVSKNRGSFEEVLGNLHKPVLVIGFESDKLYSVQEQRELAELIPNSTLAELNSPFGHDAFLIEFNQLIQEINSFSHSLNEVKQ